MSLSDAAEAMLQVQR